MGMSHGGEMLMKIASVYQGLRVGIASEPASATFLARGPADPNAVPGPETADHLTSEMQAQAVRELHARIDRKVAMQRISTIQIPIFVQGRDRDHNQDTFRVNYELLREAGKDVEWKSYDHDEHGFVYVKRNAAGHYEPDAVQREAVADSIAYFNRYMKP
jgi:acetyl esterase/lipase